MTTTRKMTTITTTKIIITATTTAWRAPKAMMMRTNVTIHQRC
jgi:hypothetical protein